ncbi:MAG: hypothetical protein AAGB51_06705 [Planctomycetota bacterium]
MSPQNQSGTKHSRLLRLAFGGLLLVASGCASTTSPAAEDDIAQTERSFREGLATAAYHVNAADLAAARRELTATETFVTTEDDAMKVRSMARLIDGAEALLEGDTERAGYEWSLIEDQALARELRLTAGSVGVDVRQASTAGGAQ